ncbi:hypothetical protein OAU13_00045 [bacterium]|nr:hypothetical protein [bacterium]
MAYLWEVTQGSLPDGLALITKNNGRSGFLSGQPTKIGNFSWTITVYDDTKPNPLSASQNYTMSISAALYLTGFLVEEGGILPDVVKGVTLDTAYSQFRLFAQELGAHNSTFTVSVVSGNKPAWLTIAAGATTNETTDAGAIPKYCYAPINFTGTPTDVGAFTFTIRVTSVTTAFQDLTIKLTVNEVGETWPPVDDYWVLSADKTGIEEGQTVRVYLTATNLTDGATVPYVIGGISASDINVPLTGNFTVTSTISREPIFASSGGILTDQIIGYKNYRYFTGYIDVTASADLATEGTETMRVALPTVTTNKAGWVTTLPINIFDTSTAPIVKKLEASVSSVQEGDSFTVTLTHTGAPFNTTFNYLIEGVSSEDIFGVPLFGEFKIGYNNNQPLSPADQPIAIKLFQIKPNGVVDTNKTFRISIPSLGLSTTVAITDANPTYSLSSTTSEIKEGQFVTFTLYTTTVADGTTIPYVISGVSAGDIGDQYGNPTGLTGNFTINKNIGSVTIRAIEDATTEGNETMTLSIPSLGSNFTKSVRILDTSLTPDPINYTLTLLKSNGEILNAADQLTEGDYFFVQIDASPEAVGSGVRYSITGLTTGTHDTAPSAAVPSPLTNLTGEWKLFSRTYTFFNQEITSAFYIAVVKTKSDGGVNNLRTITVTLPDVDKQASFLLKSAPPAPPPPSVDPVELVVAATPKGYVGVNYNYAGLPIYISYTGGTGPLTWSVSSGSLPTGMTASTENLNTVGHEYYLRGAPTTVGTYAFVITGTDTLGVSDNLSLSITVELPPSDGGGTNPGGGGTLPGGPGDLDDTLFDKSDLR